MPFTGRFRNPAARSHFMTAYQRAMERWPAYEELRIPTSYGLTAVYRTGHPGGRPMVLLHAMNATSASWVDNVGWWGERRQVYAIDAVFDPGGSSQHKPLGTEAAYRAWLGEVFGRLRLTQVHLVGHSYGAWGALLMAAYAPQRLATVTALEPAAAVSPLGLQYWLRMLPLLVRPTRATRSRFATWVLGREHQRPWLTDLVVAGMNDYSTVGVTLPRTLSDTELAAIKVPAMVVLGGNSAVSEVARTRTRLTRVLPQARLHVVEEAGHGLMVDAAPRVNALVDEFVSAFDPPPLYLGRRGAKH